MRQRLLPPAYFLLALVAMGALHFLLSGPRWIAAPWRFLGIPLALLGAGLTIYADALFKKAGTEIKPFKPSRCVVSEGPFKFSRHPMYLGFLAILAGIAVLAGTLLPLVIWGLTAWLFTVRFVVPEERHMEEQFGDEYREYRSRVRRWL